MPFYLRSGVFTMPEFLERRYSAGARWYLAIVSIIAYVLTKISVTIAAGGIVFEALMGIDFWTGALIVVIATGVYTVIGGLRAVLYTDMIQMFVLHRRRDRRHGGGPVGARRLGRDDGAPSARTSSTCGSRRRDPAFPWTGILFGAPILGVWYWCTDQFIVQRVLSARNADRGAARDAVRRLPEAAAAVHLRRPRTHRRRARAARAAHARPAPIRRCRRSSATLLPAGLRGLVVAGLLAALMSSLSSVFNSCSTLITMDVYKKLRPAASERRLVWVGRVSTAVLVVLGLLWIPLMRLISGQLYQYLQSVQAYISPPIAAVFLVGILWRRVNARGAMAALLTGVRARRRSRLVAELNKASLSAAGCSRTRRSTSCTSRCCCSSICTVILVVVSLTAPAPSSAQLAGLTFATTPPRSDDADTRGARRTDALLSGLIVLCVGALWWYFS